MIPDVTHKAIIEEIQHFRREHAAKFGYDPEAIFRDLKEAERLSGRTYVQRPPRRIAESPAVPVERRTGT